MHRRAPTCWPTSGNFPGRAAVRRSKWTGSTASSPTPRNCRPPRTEVHHPPHGHPHREHARWSSGESRSAPRLDQSRTRWQGTGETDRRSGPSYSPAPTRQRQGPAASGGASPASTRPTGSPSTHIPALSPLHTTTVTDAPGGYSCDVAQVSSPSVNAIHPRKFSLDRLTAASGSDEPSGEGPRRASRTCHWFDIATGRVHWISATKTPLSGASNSTTPCGVTSVTRCMPSACHGVSVRPPSAAGNGNENWSSARAIARPRRAATLRRTFGFRNAGHREMA